MSANHRTPEYFRLARQVRRILGPRIAKGQHVPCVDCGRPVQRGQRWDVGHIIPGINTLPNLGASHRRCNRSAGGRMGAAATNTASRRARRLPNY